MLTPTFSLPGSRNLPSSTFGNGAKLRLVHPGNLQILPNGNSDFSHQMSIQNKGKVIKPPWSLLSLAAYGLSQGNSNGRMPGSGRDLPGACGASQPSAGRTALPATRPSEKSGNRGRNCLSLNVSRLHPGGKSTIGNADLKQFTRTNCGAAKLDRFKVPDWNLWGFNSINLLGFIRAEHAAERGNNSLC